MEDAGSRRGDGRSVWEIVGPIIGGIAASGIGLFSAVIPLQHDIDELSETRSKNIADRMNDAVDHLGSDAQDVRLGGIHALRQIAEEAPEEQPDIVNLLVAFIRVHAPVPKVPRNPLNPPDPDISGALSVIAGRNVAADDGKVVEIELSQTDLMNLTVFKGTDLRKVKFDNSNLSHMYLWANLSGVRFRGANLHHTDMKRSENLTVEQIVEACPTGQTLLPPNLAESEEIQDRVRAVKENRIEECSKWQASRPVS
ncbi:pentapeptide repeat-containing protein [Streptomyces sp. NBC_00047]|uniref:pentapeptide repeat-containing protein n=1 Tax=Streptomyces sp. NBC_00047 TaxID=2975627 RepID=UPI0022589757|nr:pentapeptide repeat-containing protein [Streptomyces sp. NBC_00047]MCX5612206.1 pentapeptide repeat-containing protein [Streptomyces sp. NBC_00047]